MKKPKFEIGDTVFSKVIRQGSYEPSYCEVGEKLTVQSICKIGDTFQYVCGYDGYTFDESELMSKKEYVESL